ncbi:class III signal peptide-containing protein [Candidatus Micrarchaeota archaeon]|nr:class III signal peptide-containing protein [Candidatus Micrarchaeota archaeon]
MDNKAQGALEYLLLIGGAVLIAAIVIVILTTLGASDTYHTSSNRYNTEFHTLYHISV